MAAPVRYGFLLILLATAAGLAGCGLFGEGELTAQRARLLLAEEPAGAVSIEEAREQLAEEHHVVLVGRIAAAGTENPFVDGRTAFFLSDVPVGEHDHGPGHDADDCPFCQRAAAEAATAFVQFLDPQGDVLALDARQLFSVEPGRTVVVRGRAEIDERLEVFTVSADGLFVRE